MKKIIISLFVLWAYALSSIVWAQTLITLKIGDIKVIPSTNIARVAVGDSKVVNAVTDDDKEVILFARSQGTTTLEVWDTGGARKSFAIHVNSGSEHKLKQDIRNMLRRIPNVKATVVGEKIIVEGDRLTDADRDRVQKLVVHYPQIVDMTSQVGWDEMVMLDVQILELPRHFVQELGVKWGGLADGGISLGLGYDGHSAGILERAGETVLNNAFSRNAAGYLGINAVLSAKIQAMANQGSAVILAQPQLMARSGASAEFLAGGEVPYSVVDANGNAQTVFKPYGVSLLITPQIERNGTIRSKINVEVSSVDPSMSLTSGPALKTRRTSTEFNVRSGEPLVISGFISRDQIAGMEKLPGAGDMPVIGALFRSRKFQNNETELVIIVRPVVVSSKNPQMQTRVKRSKAIIDSSFEHGPSINVEMLGDHDSENQPRLTGSRQIQTMPMTAPRPSAVRQRPQQQKTVINTKAMRTSQWDPVLRYKQNPTVQWDKEKP